MRGGRTTARRIGTSAACVLVLLSAASLPAGETGRVVDVVDGDTLRVRSGRTVRTVRLTGIDAPEKGHPSKPREFLAEESAALLSELCFGQDVRLEGGGEDTDAYGRLLRYVYVPASAAARFSPPSAPARGPALPALSEVPAPIRQGGSARESLRPLGEEPRDAKTDPPAEILVNLEMVRQGYARVLRTFRFSREPEFLEAELGARRDGKGIWRESGLAELRWLRGGQAVPVEVWPASGNRFAVVFRGLARTDVDRRDLPAVVSKIIRLRADRADAEFEAESLKAGFRPLEAASAASRPPGAPIKGGTAPYPLVPWEEAGNHAGRKVTVEGRIVMTRREKTVLFLNFHPNWKRYLTVVVPGRDLRRFPGDAETYYRGKTVRVEGVVVLHEERPEIIVRSPGDIKVLDRDAPGP